jgi:hypothetical protein
MIGPDFPEEIPTRVSERTLRQFVMLSLAIFGGIWALSWYRHQHAPTAAGWVAGALAALIGVPGLIQPNAIRPVYLGALALTKPIGHVVGLVLLGIIYYGVLTPIALAFRLVARDGLGRFRRPTLESYWIDHLPTQDVRRYLRQYQRQAPPDRVPAAELSDPHSPALSGASHGSA